jgi:catalase
VPESAGIGSGDAAVLVAEDVSEEFTDTQTAALGLHRVWDRASDVMASAVPPSR